MHRILTRLLAKSYYESKDKPISGRFWNILFIHIGMSLTAGYFTYFFPDTINGFNFFHNVVSYSKHMDFFVDNNIGFQLELRFAWFIGLMTSPFFCYLIFRNGLPEDTRKKMIENIGKSNIFYRAVICIIAVLLPLALFFSYWTNDYIIRIVTLNMNISIVFYSTSWVACFSGFLLAKEYMSYK